MRRILIALIILTAGCGSGSSPAPHAAPAGSLRAATPTARQVLDRLTAAGLPAVLDVEYTAATDENHLLGRPNGYTSKVQFRDSRCEPDPTNHDVSEGGSIEVFADKALAKDRYDYLVAISRKSPTLGDGYDFLSGLVFLRLSATLTPDQAAEYKRALG